MRAGGARYNRRQVPPADCCTLQSNEVDRVSRVLLATLIAMVIVFLSPSSFAQTVAGPKARSPQYAVSVQQLRVSPKIRAHLAKAQQQFYRMKLSAAAEEIDQALRIDPACAQAFTMRAFIKLASQDASGAAEDAAYSASLDPNDAQAFLALATAYNSTRNFQKAEAAAGQVLRLRPDLWQGRLELVKALYQQNRLDEALLELASLKNDFPDVHLVRGNVLMKLGRRGEGAKEFQAFLDQAPHDPRGARIKQIVASLQQSSGTVVPFGR